MRFYFTANSLLVFPIRDVIFGENKFFNPNYAMPVSLQALLKSTFGYDQFRPLQQKIIENVLAKRDTLVIMPTGGGKSLCYQIPALMFTGLTVVVSPLISLMKDQVEQLHEAGVAAAFLNSSLDPGDYAKIVQQDRKSVV